MGKKDDAAQDLSLWRLKTKNILIMKCHGVS